MLKGTIKGRQQSHSNHSRTNWGELWIKEVRLESFKAILEAENPMPCLMIERKKEKVVELKFSIDYLDIYTGTSISETGKGGI